MIVEIIMPKLGIYEGDVTLIDWLVESGMEVDIGDPLFIMETEKTETEMEAEDAGFVLRVADPGLTAPIGTQIGWVASTQREYEELEAGRTPR